jgi:hypothetical protein
LTTTSGTSLAGLRPPGPEQAANSAQSSINAGEKRLTPVTSFRRLNLRTRPVKFKTCGAGRFLREIADCF